VRLSNRSFLSIRINSRARPKIRTQTLAAMADGVVAARYGPRGVALVQSIGVHDSKFLLERYFHILESPSAWQIAELAKLQHSGAFPWLAKESAKLSQQILQELDADGQSATFTKLLAELSATREKKNPKLSCWADQTIEAMGAFSEMEIRREYEAQLSTLRATCQVHMRRARWRIAAARALKFEASIVAQPTGSGGDGSGGECNGNNGGSEAGAGGGGTREPRSKRVARLSMAANLLDSRHEDRAVAFAQWAHAERRRLTSLCASPSRPRRSQRRPTRPPRARCHCAATPDAVCASTCVCVVTGTSRRRRRRFGTTFTSSTCNGMATQLVSCGTRRAASTSAIGTRSSRPPAGVRAHGGRTTPHAPPLPRCHAREYARRS
jgi:hypothetical protein